MAWTRVPQVSVGELWTAAMHNTYIRDNFAAEPPYIFDGAKQIPVGVGNNNIGKVLPPSSTAYQELTIAPPEGSTPRHLYYTHRPGIKYNQASEQTVQPDTVTVLNTTVLVGRIPPFYDYGYGNVLVPFDGWYIIMVYTEYVGGSQSGTPTIGVGFKVETPGSEAYYWRHDAHIMPGLYHRLYTTRLLYISRVNQCYITPLVWHDNVNALTVNYGSLEVVMAV